MTSVACIIPTYNAGTEIRRLIDSLQRQTFEFDILIIDSSSTDGTLDYIQSTTASVVVIPSIEFNHGGTRQRVINNNTDYDFYVFMTQDAYLDDENSIAKLLEPFGDQFVGAVCGRQLPHHDATVIAKHARQFNYPSHSQVKTLADAAVFGVKTPYMSNSFAAYRRSSLMEVGGFPDHVLFGEDMYVAAKMLIAGWKVAYSGNATCRHSHNYSMFQEFQRYFDIGAFNAFEPWIKLKFGGVSNEGLRFIKSELLFLGLRNFYLLPSVMLRTFLKLVAYKAGQHEYLLPKKLKTLIGMNHGYWNKVS